MKKETRTFIFGMTMFLIGVTASAICVVHFIESYNIRFYLLLFPLNLICAFIGAHKIYKSIL